MQIIINGEINGRDLFSAAEECNARRTLSYAELLLERGGSTRGHAKDYAIVSEEQGVCRYMTGSYNFAKTYYLAIILTFWHNGKAQSLDNRCEQ